MRVECGRDAGCDEQNDDEWRGVIVSGRHGKLGVSDGGRSWAGRQAY